MIVSVTLLNTGITILLYFGSFFWWSPIVLTYADEGQRHCRWKSVSRSNNWVHRGRMQAKGRFSYI